MLDLERTIAAVATPAGRGGVGALRLSGAAAHALAASMFRPRRPGVEARSGGRPVFGRFIDAVGRPIDHGFLVLFGPGSSFTGEPCAELWTHGSPAVLRTLLDEAMARGCAVAGPGEFTYRAVRHGRIDLARAEAIRDLIEARTAYQARVALAQAEGALSLRIAPLRERLFDLLARAEAAVEFVEESDVHLPPRFLHEGLSGVRAEATSMLDSFRAGRLVREGVRIALTGLPNVGKSSLFNALLARERAIVSRVPGTTRDTLEETLDLEGIPARLIDTAGLRDVEDAVEREGVRRARMAVAEADAVVLVLDGSRSMTTVERDALRAAGVVVPAVNKADLPASNEVWPEGAVRVSARTGAGLDVLRAAIRTAVAGHDGGDDPIVTDARHAASLGSAVTALARAERSLEAGHSDEFALDDLREAIGQLGEITGELAPEALYERIFSTFCVGK